MEMRGGTELEKIVCEEAAVELLPQMHTSLVLCAVAHWAHVKERRAQNSYGNMTLVQVA